MTPKPTRILKGSKKRAKKSASVGHTSVQASAGGQGTPGTKDKGREPVRSQPGVGGQPSKFKSIPERPARVDASHAGKPLPRTTADANAPIKAGTVQVTPEVARKLLDGEQRRLANQEVEADNRRVESQALKAATARPAASEGSSEATQMMPWPLKLTRLNKQNGDSHLMRRHELDCAAAWLYNFIYDEAKLYPSEERKEQDAFLLSELMEARMHVIQAIEAFDKRAMQETDGKYRPMFTVDQLRGEAALLRNTRQDAGQSTGKVQ